MLKMATVCSSCMLIASVRTYTWTQSDTFNVLHWSTLSRLKRHHSSTRHCLLLFLLFIINVLIKVTLNVIRCRGTLQSQWSKLTDSTSRKAEKDVNVLDGRHCQSCATSIELEHEKMFYYCFTRGGPDGHVTGLYWSRLKKTTNHLNWNFCGTSQNFIGSSQQLIACIFCHSQTRCCWI